MEKSYKYSNSYCFAPNILEIGQKGCFHDLYVSLLVIWNQKLGNTAQELQKNLVDSLGPIVFIQISWKSVRKIVVVISTSMFG
jgi:hypothetical protein